MQEEQIDGRYFTEFASQVVFLDKRIYVEGMQIAGGRCQYTFRALPSYH